MRRARLFARHSCAVLSWSRSRLRWRQCLLAGLWLVATVACAQESEPAAQSPDPTAQSPDPAAGQQMPVRWQTGPTTASIGEMAEIKLPKGYRLTGRMGTQAILTSLENPLSGTELALLAPSAEDADWFVVFEFVRSGYVRDDEGAKLDADKLLESIRKANERSNQQRSERGWPTMQIVGWEHPPAYDKTTRRLSWAVRATSEGQPIVNYNTRLLGRFGVMSAVLVVSPDQLDAVLPEFNKLLEGYSYKTGHKYSEFRPGDKIAKYGLTALITGGAAAAAVKFGLFKKFWKLLVVAVLAAGAGLKKLFGLFRGKQSRDPGIAAYGSDANE